MHHETERLLAYLEERGLNEPKACAVMGEALNALLASPEAKFDFLHALATRFGLPPAAAEGGGDGGGA